MQVAVEAVAHGNVDHHECQSEEVFHGFAQHEEQGARVGSRARGGGHVEVFHVFVVVQAEVESFHFVVDLGRNGSVLHIKVEA